MPAKIVIARSRFRRSLAAPAALVLASAGLVSPAVTPTAAAVAPVTGTRISVGGYQQTCSIEHGKAYCWGDNSAGELGDGTTMDMSTVPVPVSATGALAGKTLVQISVSLLNACALDSAGAVYCWGSDVFGQLGDGSASGQFYVGSNVPVAVSTSGALAGKTITQIAVGDYYACALDSTGAAYCWGSNEVGQLGDGGTTDSSVPVAVSTSGALAGKILTQISIDGNDACALDSTGAAYCWPNPLSGPPFAFGPGGALTGKTLAQISGISQGGCGLDTTGAAYCWGYGDFGQLGNGSTSTVNGAVAVSTSGVLAGKTLTRISAGSFSTCAVDNGGAGYCWGSNGNGVLGDGSTAESDVPVAVSTGGALAGKFLTQISTDGYHTCAADRSGADYCWGGNTHGQLGTGNFDNSSSPIAVVYPPADITVAPGQTSAQVSWAPAASPGGGTLTGYTATASPGGQSCTTTTTSCTITGLAGLAAGQTYTVTVVTRSSTGTSGASAPPVPFPASDGPIVSGYHKTACLDDPGYSGTDGTSIVMWECNGTNEQNWTVKKDGTIRINGKCLDVHQGGKASKTPVDLATCTGNAQEQWHAVNGTLVNPRSSDCLDDPRFNTANGTPLEIYTCNGGANQQWKLP